jgi:hypothetical protein
VIPNVVYNRQNLLELTKKKSDNFERKDERTITAIIRTSCVAEIRRDYELTFDTVKGEFNITVCKMVN